MQKNCLTYPVEFAQDAFGDSDALANMLLAGRRDGAPAPRVLIVADQNVVQRTEGIGAKIGRYVRAHSIELAGTPVVVGSGEKIKVDGLQSALRVAAAVSAAGLGRDDAVLALGGGSVIDVAGWAAAQVGGGVPVVRVPTTPEAMLDAAFSEFAALDLYDEKDALRVRSSPAGVVIDTSFAATVLDGVWRGGVGEAVRLALARDAALFREVAELAPAYGARDAAALDRIVRGALATRSKKGSTTFALWSALRLQAMSGWKLPHGYAVSIGVLVDLAYAVVAGKVKDSVCDMAFRLLGDCGTLDGLVHSQYLLLQPDGLLPGLDAWRRASPDGAVELLSGVGKTCRTKDVDLEVVREALKYIVSLTSRR